MHEKDIMYLFHKVMKKANESFLQKECDTNL